MRGLKKKRFDASFEESKLRLIAVRKKGRTELRHAYTLEKLSTTKRFNLDTIETALKKRRFSKRRFNIIFKKGKLSTSFVVPRLLEREVFENSYHEYRTRPLRNKIGKLFMSVTFFGMKGQKVTSEAGSRQPRDLSVRSELEKAYNDAFAGCMRQDVVNFSYERFEINWVHFRYVFPKQRVMVDYV